KNGIRVRAFVLLNPPFITDPDENIEWCLKTVGFAFEQGIHCCSIIPVRSGTVEMENLRLSGQYHPPTLDALEHVVEKAMNMKGGGVFVDLWDLDRFSDCDVCLEKRKERLARMNLLQESLPPI